MLNLIFNNITDLNELLLVVGGNDGAASHAVDLLSLDTSIDDPACLKGLLHDFPAKLEGAMGATLGASNLLTSLDQRQGCVNLIPQDHATLCSSFINVM